MSYVLVFKVMLEFKIVTKSIYDENGPMHMSPCIVALANKMIISVRKTVA